MMTLTLSHAANPDIRGGYWEGKPDCPRVQKVEVATLADAKSAFRNWRELNGIGGGNCPSNCGEIREGRKLVARISYNCRVWAPNGDEITV